MINLKITLWDDVTCDYFPLPLLWHVITYLSTFYGPMAKVGILVISLPTEVDYSFAKSRRNNIMGEIDGKMVHSAIFYNLH